MNLRTGILGFAFLALSTAAYSSTLINGESETGDFGGWSLTGNVIPGQLVGGCANGPAFGDTICTSHGGLFAAAIRKYEPGFSAIPAFPRDHRPIPCSRLLAIVLPSNISVYADKAIKPQTVEAMESLSERLGFHWHFAPQKEAEIQVHFVAGAEYMHAGRAGEAYLPWSPNFDGIARVRFRDSWIVAHEICHVLGFEHSETGLMRPNRSSKLIDGLTDQEIHHAALVRAAAASRRHLVQAETGLQAINSQ